MRDFLNGIDQLNFERNWGDGWDFRLHFCWVVLLKSRFNEPWYNEFHVTVNKTPPSEYLLNILCNI